MSICPEGHQSDSDDYCDVCGTPIVAGGSTVAGAPGAPAAAGPSTPPAQQGIPCPHCGVENVPDALFCEACGYDFTTGTLPRPMANPFALPGDEEESAAAPDLAAPESTEVVESGVVDDPSAADGDDFANFPSVASDAGGYDTPVATGGYDAAPASTGGYDSPTVADDDPVSVPTTPPAASPVSAQPAPPAGSGEPQPEAAAMATTPEPLDTGFGWVAEVWIDPDWYRKQQPPDPMPSPGLPDVVPLRGRSILIGRVSRSRNIHPDIDCDADPGASRRQAQLTTDGKRWWVEDLDSANGTYVAGAADGLPDDPIRVGQRHELDPDDRIYLGAWTRLVIRQATEEEQEAY